MPPSSSKSKIVNLVIVIVSRRAFFKKPVVIMSDNNKRIRSPEGTATSGKKRCDPRAEATQPHLEKATQAKLAAAARLARLRAETEANRQSSSATLAVPPTSDALQEAILASQIEMGASATPRPSSFVLPGFEKMAQAAGLTVKTPNTISKTNLATRPKNQILTQKSCSNKLTLKLACITKHIPLLVQADIRADELQANLEAEMDAIINGAEVADANQAAAKVFKKPTKIPVRESGFAPSSARKTGRGRPKATATATRPTPVLSEYEDEEDVVSIDSNNNTTSNNNDNRPMMNIIRDIVQEKTSQAQPEGYVTEVNQVIRDEDGRVPELAKAKPTTVAQLRSLIHISEPKRQAES